MVKEFLKRGLMFSGCGPLIYSIVLLIIHCCGVDTTCTGIDIFKAVFSTFVMAFLIAGVSVVWQNERLGLGFASVIHGCTLYLSYIVVYLLNNWIPRNIFSVLGFTIIFVFTYLVIWLIIYLVQRAKAKELNLRLLK